MLFNSYIFLLLYLPITLLGYYTLGRMNVRMAAIWLSVGSLVFYGWWSPVFLILLIGSIAVNYIISQMILNAIKNPEYQSVLLAAGVTLNLSLLFYYKYFAAIFDFLIEYGFMKGEATSILLPLGISFFTFTQIGYLLDCKAGIVKERSALSYVLFVTFFPHLLAGPILHHKEMMVQFSHSDSYKFKPENLSIGGMLFLIGLTKKVIFADGIAPYADSGFAATQTLQFWQAWGAILAYGLQVYFDFSGYSDMALGLAKMFGIRFPLNFNSPYQATSVIDFWARWHMTLTRYITSYLYYPLSMAISRYRSRRGLAIGSPSLHSFGGLTSAVLVPTFFTMILAGIWHGAGLQFLIFGILHAVYLSVNHIWRIFFANKTMIIQTRANWCIRTACVTLTFIAILFAQSFFRADGVQQAFEMIQGMLGVRGLGDGLSFYSVSQYSFGDAWRQVVSHHLQLIEIILLFVIVWCAPNAHQIMGVYSPALVSPHPASIKSMQWKPDAKWLFIMLLLLVLCLFNLQKETRFLYFQF